MSAKLVNQGIFIEHRSHTTAILTNSNVFHSKCSRCNDNNGIVITSIRFFGRIWFRYHMLMASRCIHLCAIPVQLLRYGAFRKYTTIAATSVMQRIYFNPFVFGFHFRCLSRRLGCSLTIKWKKPNKHCAGCADGQHHKPFKRNLANYKIIAMNRKRVRHAQNNRLNANIHSQHFGIKSKNWSANDHWNRFFS